MSKEGEGEVDEAPPPPVIVEEDTHTEYNGDEGLVNITEEEEGEGLLCGEKVQQTAKDVTYMCPYTGRVNGTLYITDYKVGINVS